MKVSLLEAFSSKRKIFSGLREKFFDHDDSTSLCHSKTLTEMKIDPVPEYLLIKLLTGPIRFNYVSAVEPSSD